MSDYNVVVEPPPTISVTVETGQGPAGVGGGSYKHTQSTAASTWVVNHNLGFRPNVAVTSLGGLLMLCEVLHISDNQVQVLTDTPTTGLALCS